MYKKDQIVTIPVDETASNTLLVAREVDNEAAEVLLYHPRFPDVLLPFEVSRINKLPARMKCSTERSLEYTINNKGLLGFNATSELMSLYLFFIVNRHLTTTQKRSLSDYCGKIATIHFRNNIKQAIEFVIKNEALLDDFNKMWYNNFKRLFSFQEEIKSKKQRIAIFNIAGFVLAECQKMIAPQV